MKGIGGAKIIRRSKKLWDEDFYVSITFVNLFIYLEKMIYFDEIIIAIDIAVDVYDF